jgi:hypothetical protein
MNNTRAHQRLRNEILLALGSRAGLCRVWPQNSGAVQQAGRWIHFGLVGCADISGIMVDGRRLEIEVKTGKGVQSDAQRNFAEMIRRMGGVYILARSVDEAVRGVEESRR